MPRGKATHEELRVLGAVRWAQAIVPEYARRGPISRERLSRLAAACRLVVHRAELDMDAPAVLLPPVDGAYRLVLSRGVQKRLVPYVTLHEIGHIVTGDADEPTFLTARAALPAAEDIADSFALLGFLSPEELRGPPADLRARILARVPLGEEEWERTRVPRLAAKVFRLGRLLCGEP